jgi:hypothetical protein
MANALPIMALGSLAACTTTTPPPSFRDLPGYMVDFSGPNKEGWIREGVIWKVVAWNGEEEAMFVCHSSSITGSAERALLANLRTHSVEPRTLRAFSDTPVNDDGLKEKEWQQNRSYVEQWVNAHPSRASSCDVRAMLHTKIPQHVPIQVCSPSGLCGSRTLHIAEADYPMNSPDIDLVPCWSPGESHVVFVSNSDHNVDYHCSAKSLIFIDP